MQVYKPKGLIILQSNRRVSNTSFKLPKLNDFTVANPCNNNKKGEFFARFPLTVNTAVAAKLLVRIWESCRMCYSPNRHERKGHRHAFLIGAASLWKKNWIFQKLTIITSLQQRVFQGGKHERNIHFMECHNLTPAKLESRTIYSQFQWAFSNLVACSLFYF